MFNKSQILTVALLAGASASSVVAYPVSEFETRNFESEEVYERGIGAKIGKAAGKAVKGTAKAAGGAALAAGASWAADKVSSKLNGRDFEDDLYERGIGAKIGKAAGKAAKGTAKAAGGAALAAGATWAADKVSSKLNGREIDVDFEELYSREFDFDEIYERGIGAKIGKAAGKAAKGTAKAAGGAALAAGASWAADKVSSKLNGREFDDEEVYARAGGAGKAAKAIGKGLGRAAKSGGKTFGSAAASAAGTAAGFAAADKVSQKMNSRDLDLEELYARGGKKQKKAKRDLEIEELQLIARAMELYDELD